MDKQTYARILADIVGTHYGLSPEALKTARDSAGKRADKAIRIYLAILRSL